jgi:6-pyruvoyltetrahydropterin/6-carboxytetrahydropterin synthase
MFTIKRRASFEYAHRLLNHPALCQYLHGHSGRAEVEIMSNALDDQGMVEDFSVLKKAMNAILDQWDHATLLQATDPLKPIFDLHNQRVYTFEEPPTAEVMSRTLFNKLQDFFPGRVKRVTISETENNQATFERGIES